MRCFFKSRKFRTDINSEAMLQSQGGRLLN